MPDPDLTKKRYVRIRSFWFTLLFLFISLLGAASVVTIFGARTYHWRAFDVEVSIYPAISGSTRLRFIPLGEILAPTHKTPLALQISLMNISFNDAKKLITNPPPRKELEAEFTHAARRDIKEFALFQIMFGAIGGLLAPVLFRSRRFREWLISSLVGGGFVALVFFSTVRTFSPGAFENPKYTGSLQQADWIITLVKDGFNKAEALSEKLKNVANNLSKLYERINSVPRIPADEDSVTILHITDIHNNPAAVAFVRELVASTRVDMVIDTGDLTDFGSPLEIDLSKGMAQLKVPYVFLAGNHDSLAVLRAVRKYPNAIIMEGTPVEVKGLSILGSSDPSSSKDGANNVDTPPESLLASGKSLEASFDKAPVHPDIVCVHDPRQGEPLIGKAKLILCGHEHRSYMEIKQGTVICNAGTTGAAGGRYFDKASGVPLSAAILRFTRPPNPRLLLIDRVVLDGALSQYSISRETFNNATGMPENLIPKPPPAPPAH